jgi:hypothetical protein
MKMKEYQIMSTPTVRGAIRVESIYKASNGSFMATVSNGVDWFACVGPTEALATEYATRKLARLPLWRSCDLVEL